MAKLVNHGNGNGLGRDIAEAALAQETLLSQGRGAWKS